MQGVYIERGVESFGALEMLVNQYPPALVFIKSTSGDTPYTRYIRLMTTKQAGEFIATRLLPENVDSFLKGVAILELLNPPETKGESRSRAEGSTLNLFTIYLRPQLKKELKEQVANNPDSVYLEAASLYGNEYSGRLSFAPLLSYSVVGPDPYLSRAWRAEITWSDRYEKWIVR